jgi:predicted type IV restriction endonuclease
MEERLRSIIFENNQKVTRYSEEYAKNESAVRSTLVEPILNTLGWNTHTLDDVRQEVRTEDGKYLDYVLRMKGKDLLVVETKNQGENLEKHLSQLALYCTSMGIPFGVITNGSL